MVDREVLAQQWTDVCARLKQKWSQLSEADFRACEESVERLVEQIEQKTGESREVIEQFLAQLADEAAAAASELRDKLHVGAGYAADSARQGYQAAERVVQQRPGQSLAVAFGLGVAAGVGVAILLRDRPGSRSAHHGAMAEQFGRQLADVLARFTPKQ